MEKISLKVSSDDEQVGYVYLPDHPKKQIPGLVKRQIELADLIKDYKGPDVNLDFNSEGVLIGIEIIG